MLLVSVIVLYEVHKAVDNIQHIIKWIIDRYSDICKLVLCCEDDADILEPVKNRFKVIQVDAPQTHEVRIKKFRKCKSKHQYATYQIMEFFFFQFYMYLFCRAFYSLRMVFLYAHK